MNKVIMVANALLSGSIRLGPKNELLISDSNLILQLDEESLSGGSSSGTLHTFMVSTLYGADYVGATEVFRNDMDDGWVAGQTIRIAKPWHLRPSVTSETIEGINVLHVYADENNRVTDDGDNEESQVMSPRYIAGGFVDTVPQVDSQNVIYAMDTGRPTGLIDLITGLPLTWIETEPSRMWVSRHEPPI